MFNLKPFIVFSLLWKLSIGIAFSQTDITNKGVSITIAEDTVYVKGSYLNDRNTDGINGEIANGGVLYVSRDFVNQSKGKVFVTDAGKVILNGSEDRRITGDSSIALFKVEVDKSAGEVTLAQHVLVRDTLALIQGSVNLNNQILDLGNSGFLLGETNQNRVYGDNGVIRVTRFINNTDFSTNLGGIGLALKTGGNFGFTRIERGHAQQNTPSPKSIFRYYRFTPANADLIDSLRIAYLDQHEVPENEAGLLVFTSNNNGVTWRNKGGLSDIARNFATSATVTPPALGTSLLTLSPVTIQSSCADLDSSRQIKPIFLVNSLVNVGDTVQFIQLSHPVPDTYYWDFDDSFTSTQAAPSHIYATSRNYNVLMTVGKDSCTYTTTKTIEILPLSQTNQPNGREFLEITELKAFPNPTSGNIHIWAAFNQKAEVELSVHDLYGRTLWSQTESTASFYREVNLQTAKPGMYLFTLKAGPQLKTFRVIRL